MMNYNQQRLGSNIRTLRKKKRWSMKELADYAGITPSFLGLVERGERGLSLENVCKLCNIFTISIDDLVTKDYSGESHSAKENSKNDLRKQIEILLSAMSEDDVRLVFGIIQVIKGNRKDAPKNMIRY